MKIEELIAFLDVGEYGTELLDYGWGPTDVDDAITEIADGHVSIFKYDALRFLSAHPELVDDAIREYGWEAIPDELASLIREWASGDVRTMDEIPAKIRGYFQIKEEE